jgi:hypothetical protein
MRRHFQMQAAIMRDGDRMGEAGADRVIGPGKPLLQQPGRADRAAGFLVIGQMQLDRAAEGRARVAQRLQREGIGGEVRLGDSDAAPIHPAVALLGAVGIAEPARAGGDHVAMRIQRHGRAGAEAVAHDQVGGADHAGGTDRLGRDGVALDGEAEGFQQGGGADGMGGAVARRVVGRDADQLGEEIDLFGMVRVDMREDRGRRYGSLGGFGRAHGQNVYEAFRARAICSAARLR